MRRASLALLFAASLTACLTRVEPPRYASIGFEEGAVEGWGQVLRQFVDDSGRVDLEGLRAQPQALERYVTWVANNGPRLTPARFKTPERRLAFYVNAYNALAMYGVLRTGREPEQRLRFFRATRFPVDGREVSLEELEQDLIRPLGDERAHFALNAMTVGGPRLRREPYRAEALDDQLERAAVEFLNDPRNARYDAEHDEARLSWILGTYRSDFLRGAPSLIAYANRYRANWIPEDAGVDILAFDWSLNDR
jgi:Protein of unknown function, DUF547